MILRGPYQPRPGDSRMRTGGVAPARAAYLARRSPNLEHLLRTRYEWINDWVGPDDVGVELGCGIGAGAAFVRARTLQTDVSHGEWLDVAGVDALATPFADGHFDFVVVQNVLHHLSHPIRFFPEAARILKPGGVLLVRDVVCSTATRVLARLTRVEGYSYDVDVFDPDAVLSDPADPWSANNAVPDLLFDDRARLARAVPELEVVHERFAECLLLLNSGGVTHKTVSIPLPLPVLRALHRLDDALTARWPRRFAMQRDVVLRRKGGDGAR